MSAIGIDLGSFRTVIAAVVRGGVEILANESSYRQTSNMIGYGKDQRLLGDQAASKIKKNYKNTACFFTRLLNCEFGSAEYKAEKKHLFTKMVAGDNNYAAYKVNYQGSNVNLSPVQVLASHFNKVLQVLQLNNINNQKDMVVTIPGYLTIDERQSIHAAGAIAGIRIVSLVEESECNVKNYGIFRRKDLTTEPRTVAFVDFGHSKTSIYFAEITNKKAKIIHEENVRHLGARDLDLALYAHLRDKFEEETNNNTDENPKAKLRLLQAIEKCRKVLSANTDASCSVEFLMDDEDFSTNVTREEFEKIGSHIFGKFREAVRSAILNSGIAANILHSVEILGGASRIPLIQQIICEELKQKEVSRTLDQTESCARGAAIKAAEKSPNFQVAEFAVKSINKHNIRCNYLMFKQSENTVKEMTGVLFKKGCKLPSTMSVSVGKTLQSKLHVYYDEPVPARTARDIFDVNTAEAKPKEEDFKLVLRAVLGEDGIPVFKGADLEEYYIEEVKKPIEKKKTEEKPAEGGMQEEGKTEETAAAGGDAESKMQEEEPEYEIKKVKKTRITHLQTNNQIAPLYPEHVIQNLRSQEQNMLNQDNQIVLRHKTRNDLEARVYEAKAAVNEGWAVFINPDEAKHINGKAEELELWLYDEGMDATTDVYQQNLGLLNSLCQPVEDRAAAHKTFGEAIGYLGGKIQQYSGKVEENVSFFKKTMNFLHIQVRALFLTDDRIND